MNIGEINGIQVAVSPKAYEEIKKQKIIEENKILKEQQQELERYKNIIDETFNYCKEQQEKSFDVVAEECYTEVMYFISQKKEELKGE